jgi:hypothetical protein
MGGHLPGGVNLDGWAKRPDAVFYLKPGQPEPII